MNDVSFSSSSSSSNPNPSAPQHQEIDKSKVILDPHTLRLLRLIQYPGNVSKDTNNNNEEGAYADHAARMLGQVTSQCSPLVLWDILGRLRHVLLHSPLWSTRQCASFAMTLVAHHLPYKDQQEFVSGTVSEDEDAPFLWLTVHDLARPSMPANTISLDEVLSKGRLLLSQLESFYNVNDEEDETLQPLCSVEDSILNTLDTKAIAIVDSSTETSEARNVSKFFDARVQYQRSIMARRLGLVLHDDVTQLEDDASSFARNFVARELLSHGFLTDYITSQDIIATRNIDRVKAVATREAANNSKKPKKRRKGDKKGLPAEPDCQHDNTPTVNSQSNKKKKRAAHQEPNADNDEDYGMVRALLVLEMKSDNNNNSTILSSKSHSRPRTLLATDLLFSMLDPNWSVRHGACLGILALCKAWMPITKVNTATANNIIFGSWLHDILARSLCILGLDRFGDFSDDTNPSSGGGGVVAPVRQVASQLLAFLWKLAPHETQVETLRLLQHMTHNKQHWEVRHGALLAFLHICAVTLSTSSPIPAFHQEETEKSRASTTTELKHCSILRISSGSPKQSNNRACGSLDILSIATECLKDVSDDVRAISSRIILQLIRSSDGESIGLADWNETVISMCIPHLWQALKETRGVSSCVTDLLILLEGLISLNVHSVVHNILHTSLNSDKAKPMQQDFTVTTKNHIAERAYDDDDVNSPSPSEICGVICQILEKLVGFLDYDYISCQISSLDVVAKVIEPISVLTSSLMRDETNSTIFKQDKEHNSYPFGLNVVNILCNLLIKIYNSFWETTLQANSDPMHQRRYQDAKDRCWHSLVEAVAPSRWEQQFILLPPLTEKLNAMYGTLILSLFGIIICDSRPSSSPTEGFKCESGVSQELLFDSNLCIKRREQLENDVAYERLLQGAVALTQLSAKLFEPAFATDDADDSKRLKSNNDPESMLHLFLQMALESPWQHVAEAGIALYTAVADKGTENRILLAFLDEHEQIAEAESITETFTKMLYQEPPFCIRVQQNCQNAEILLNCKSTQVVLCDKIMVSALKTLLTSCKRPEGGKDLKMIAKIARDVTDVWKRSFVSDTVDGISATPATVSIITTVNLMRVRSEISCAIVSRGIDHLPTQLTPVIQSLMTSLQHEHSSSRQNVISCKLADLFLLLSNEKKCNTDLENLQRRRSTCKKIIASVCALIFANSSRALHGNDTNQKHEYLNSAERVISRLIIESHSSGVSSGLSLLWSELDPLVEIEDGYVEGEKITQILYLLKVISESIKESPNELDTLAAKILCPVCLIACNSPSAPIRQIAAISVKNFCFANRFKCVPTVIPIVFDALRDMEDDARRFGGGRLLHSIVESLGIHICPFIKCLLPAVMSSLNDAIEDCAKTAASTFAALVRAAPLVIDDQICMTSLSPSRAPSHVHGLPNFLGSDDDSTSKIIDHLVHGKPLPAYVLPPKLCAAMKDVQLREYQMEGVSWIRFLTSVNLNGVLADDMGLGKTLETLVAIGASYLPRDKENEVLPSLVVCPATVVGHWIDEIDRYFSNDFFKAWLYAGSTKKRRYDCDKRISVSNIVVTSYAMLRNDVQWFSSKRWNYLVLDEGHLLKNPRTATAKAARKLSSRHKLLLSGTPVQNRVQEIFAIFDILMPNYLGTESTFSKHFAKPIIDGQMPGATAEEVGRSAQKLKLLHQQVLPFILRREKSQVLRELPPKIITNVLCELSTEQTSLYRMVSAKPETKQALEHLRTGFTHRHVSNNSSLTNDLSSALKSLLILRLLCTHPKLILSPVTNRDECTARKAKTPTHTKKKSASISIPEKLESLRCSGKLLALNDLLRSAGVYRGDVTGADNDISCIYVENEDRGSPIDASFSNYFIDDESGNRVKDSLGQKCLIFAQFSRSLDIVEKYLFQPHMPSLRYLRLDGKVPQEHRTDIVNRFNSDESIRVMILTTKIGGLGLNLSTAQLVILLESDWNPHADLQAIDRAHRIGQKNTLQVYRLITKDTVEEKIMRLQERKMAMSEAIINTENSSIYSMGTDRLLDLFTFQTTESDDEKLDVSSFKVLEEYEVEGLDKEYSNLTVEEFVSAFQQ